jgi:hypothetical protein
MPIAPRTILLVEDNPDDEELTLRDGKLYVNGALMLEPYVEFPGQLEIAPGRIPPNSFGVIGDNRAGTVIALANRERIVGRLRW